MRRGTNRRAQRRTPDRAGGSFYCTDTACRTETACHPGIAVERQQIGAGQRNRRSYATNAACSGSGLVQRSACDGLNCGWIASQRDAELGCDGVIAKRLDEPYHSGDREAMVKIKRLRSADCVVGGFRYAQKGGEIGSLLLGLFDKDGKLNHIGFSASFAREERKKLKNILLPLEGPPGFTGSAPGGPSRWATERSTEWHPLKHKLVCEVQVRSFFRRSLPARHKVLALASDKGPRQCTYDQLRVLTKAA